MKLYSSLCAIFLVSLVAAHAQIYDWNGEALAGVKINTVAFRGWIPTHTGPLAGTLVLIPGRHGDGRGMATEPRWQELANEVGLAVVACQFADGEPFPYQTDQTGEVAGAINQAVEHLSKESQHPELAKAPLAFWGTSAGSNVSACYCTKFPKRVLAFGSSKGTFGPGGDVPPDAREIPMFFALGAKDNPDWTGPSQVNIEKGTKLRAPWTLAYNQAEGHDVGNSLDAIIPFLKAAIQQRLAPANAAVALPAVAKSGFKSQLPGFSKPTTATTATATIAAPETKLSKIDQQNGWLGDAETYEVAQAKDFKGRKSSAVWLADETSANAWKAYLQTGAN